MSAFEKIGELVESVFSQEPAIMAEAKSDDPVIQRHWEVKDAVDFGYNHMVQLLNVMLENTGHQSAGSEVTKAYQPQANTLTTMASSENNATGIAPKPDRPLSEAEAQALVARAFESVAPKSASTAPLTPMNSAHAFQPAKEPQNDFSEAA